MTQPSSDDEEIAAGTRPAAEAAGVPLPPFHFRNRHHGQRRAVPVFAAAAYVPGYEYALALGVAGHAVAAAGDEAIFLLVKRRQERDHFSLPRLHVVLHER